MAALTAASVFSCNRAGEDLPPPNILWINCEDIGPDLGCYGSDYPHTPNLDAMAEEGVVFTRAYAAAPICSPSRSTLITGIAATSMGTQHLRCNIDLPEFIKTLPEYLRDAGYFTSMYGKTDYNFNPDRPDERFDYLHWQEDWAPWRKRGDKPFYGYFTLGMTHEGSTQSTRSWERNTAELPQEIVHDPAKVPLPPKQPDTPEMRKVWAHYHDNITLLDTLVGHILSLLKADGELENTFVFFFSDHGAGMPGHKRFLSTTGVQVPLVIHVPRKYRHLADFRIGSKSDRLVTFSDFAPTVLNLAGAGIPETMTGTPFMGEKSYLPREYVACSRSRADNMYETSRCVIDDHYLYVRHYRPHYPYAPPGYIYETDRKEAWREVQRLHAEGTLNPEAEAWFHPKPVEELYDLKEDAGELNNLASLDEYAEVKSGLHGKLREWILSTRDVGFLNEPEYMIRSAGSTIYEMGQDDDTYDLTTILDAAEMVGNSGLQELEDATKHPDSGVRFWAVMGLQEMGEDALPAVPVLSRLLDDPSPAVQVEAAFTLARLGETEPALDVLGKWVQDERGWLALQAARSIELLGEHARPLVPVLYEVMETYAAEPGSRSRFRDSDFAFFISMSVIYALEHCGEVFENPLD